MKYMLIHALDESRVDDIPPQVETELTSWADEMVGRGIELDGARLFPTSDATTVRAPAGDVQVTDGPFAETKEQIAGYYVIDCPDLDTAIAVAGAHPTLNVGAIEVRAFHDGMPDPQVPERIVGRHLRRAVNGMQAFFTMQRDLYSARHGTGLANARGSAR